MRPIYKASPDENNKRLFRDLEQFAEERVRAIGAFNQALADGVSRSEAEKAFTTPALLERLAELRARMPSAIAERSSTTSERPVSDSPSVPT